MKKHELVTLLTFYAEDREAKDELVDLLTRARDREWDTSNALRKTIADMQVRLEELERGNGDLATAVTRLRARYGTAIGGSDCETA